MRFFAELAKFKEIVVSIFFKLFAIDVSESDVFNAFNVLLVPFLFETPYAF